MNNVNGIMFIEIKRQIKHVREDVDSWARVIHEIHEHWFPTNNDDSTVHAVHLEHIADMTLNVFMLAFRRFIRHAK